MSKHKKHAEEAPSPAAIEKAALKQMSEKRRTKTLAAIYDLAHSYLTGEDPGPQTCKRLMKQEGETIIEDGAYRRALEECDPENVEAVQGRHRAIGLQVFELMRDDMPVPTKIPDTIG